MVGGRLKNFYDKWRSLTSDPYILNAVKGYKLEFDPNEFPTVRGKELYNLSRSSELNSQIEEEISRLLAKNVIELCEHENGEFISNIFTRPKKNGSLRVILDLSDLNTGILYQHFKMDNIHTALSLLSPNCYIASIDLQDAYYSVPVHPSSRKYLRFYWQSKLYQYKALPNGLSSAPRLFTKMLKPVFAQLRTEGHVVMGYLDDTLIIGRSKDATQRAVSATTKLLTELGFLIHPEKSVLSPGLDLEFLGFHLNTRSMHITLPREKQDDIYEVCTSLLSLATPSIRKVARVIGKIVATFPAVQYGPLHYRYLERDKVQALKAACGHFDRPMTLSMEARHELIWWKEHIHESFNHVVRQKVNLELRTDASAEGWGATDLTSHTGGRWTTEEVHSAQTSGINYLETLAAGLALKSFCADKRNVHVLLRIDNTTAVAYLNNMGGLKSETCNQVVLDIWHWCIERNIWLSAAHLPGCQNNEADFMSRHFNDRTEWMLDKNSFEKIVAKYGTPVIDLFASRLNAQLPRYISWLPDPNAESVDAFTLDWGKFALFYAFPPFCLVAKCLQKIQEDNAHGLLVVPNWPTQAWFPLLTSMMSEEPLILKRSKSLLTQPVSKATHPLCTKLDLLCCRIGVHSSR